MGVDKTTVPNFLNIVLPSNPVFVKQMQKQAKEDDQEANQMSISDSMGNLKNEEYYYDDNDNEIVYTGLMSTEYGEVFFSIHLPLSNTILIDVLQMSVKKFNKLKTTLEALN